MRGEDPRGGRLELAEDPRAGLGRILAREVPTVAAQMAPLAEYFLEYHSDLLAEWLDALGLEHEKGVLATSSPECPKPADLATTVTAFRQGKDPERRELLMRAFAAQSSIEWPDLEALLAS